MKRSRMVAGFLSGLLMLGATTAGSAGGIHETDGYLLRDNVERLGTLETDYIGMNVQELPVGGPLIMFLAVNALVGFLLLRRD